MPKFDVNQWRKVYKTKEISLKQLEEIIKPGSRIYLGSGCSEPTLLTAELTKDKYRWQDCQIFHFFSFSDNEFFDERSPSTIRHNTLAIVGSRKLRNAINTGKSDFTPILSSDIPRMLSSSRYRINIDVALVQVSPPDTNGFCSLGINVDINKAMVEQARIVIAQINPEMPRTMGDSFVRFENIDYFIYQSSPLLEYRPLLEEQTEQNEHIAEHVARLVENGSTLNLGIGKIPYLVPKYLTEKKDLAIYSEMIMADSIMPLIDEGVITCKQNYYPHCMTSLAIGSQSFYKRLGDNPFFEFRPTEYIVNIPRIARNQQLCSIYSAVKVDLIGQATNHLRSHVYEGMGGEADFMTGTNLSAGGRAIIALPSTTKSGKSRIMPLLSYEPVSLRTEDVHYVVTEYGIAYLHGKTVRERILQMIGIAHPDFRKELLDQAKEFHFVYEDQRLPTTQDGVVIIYPDIAWTYRSKSGEILHFRPVMPTDEREVQEHYYQLTPEDRISRFFNFRSTFDHKITQARIICDYQNSMMIVGISGSVEEKHIVALGEYSIRANTGLAEIALSVGKEYRNQGLGRHIILKLIDLAAERGFIGICGDILATNNAMMHLLKTLPYEVVFHGTGDSTEFIVRFDTKKIERKSS